MIYLFVVVVFVVVHHVVVHHVVAHAFVTVTVVFPPVIYFIAYVFSGVVVVVIVRSPLLSAYCWPIVLVFRRVAIAVSPLNVPSVTSVINSIPKSSEAFFIA